MQILILLYLFSIGAFGLVLNETYMSPPTISTFVHLTATFGVQSTEASYERTAQLVKIEPEASCKVANKEELTGSIVLVKKGGVRCSFFDQAYIVANSGGIGMVLGNNEGEIPNQMWKPDVEHRDVDIPCVSITKDLYTTIASKLTDGIIVATISTDGELKPSSALMEYTSLSKIVTDVLIVLPTLWFLVALRYCCRRSSSNRRDRRLNEMRNRKIPDILFTKDFLISKIDCEEKSTNWLTNDSCPICLDRFVERTKIKRLPCGHGYHDECIGPWLANPDHDSCPICRQSVSDKLEVREDGSRTFCCCYSGTGQESRRRWFPWSEREESVPQSSLENHILIQLSLDLNRNGQGVQISQIDEPFSMLHLEPFSEPADITLQSPFEDVSSTEPSFVHDHIEEMSQGELFSTIPHVGHDQNITIIVD